MDEREMRAMLAAVADGSLDPDEAALRLKTAPFTDLGYAKVDHQRGIYWKCLPTRTKTPVC